jgi:hypothetical protein
LRLCAFAPLRLCAFAPLRLCAFAPLRLCAFAPLRLCVFASLREIRNSFGKIVSRKGPKPAKTIDLASRIEESNNEYENFDSHNFNHIREHAGTRSEQQSEHEFNHAHSHGGCEAFGHTEDG